MSLVRYGYIAKRQFDTFVRHIDTGIRKRDSSVLLLRKTFRICLFSRPIPKWINGERVVEMEKYTNEQKTFTRI